MKLSDIAIIKTNFPDADFWLIRRGSKDTVGKPVKEFATESIGIKVTTDAVLPDYLYYIFMHLHLKGVWKQLSTGSLNLVHITTKMVRDIPVGSTK
jgi:hypothetical protein